MPKPAPRPNHLAAIHMAFKNLGISKDDAVSVKLQVTGVASAGDMTAKQRQRLLAHLASLQADRATARGEKPAYVPKRPGVQRSVDDEQDARWHKARSLWAALATAGVVRVNSDDALSTWVKRQTKVECWRFLNTHQINNLVIEPLKKWCVDKGVPIHPTSTSEP